jgi:hypothetical protein
MVFGFHWTDDSEAHIARHGVSPEEVEQATERPFYTMPGRDGTTLLFGRHTRVAACSRSSPSPVMAAGMS